MKKLFSLLFVLFVGGLAGFAQQSAGGKWIYSDVEDKLTGARSAIFELPAEEKITDGIAFDFPSFVVMCGGGRWINSKLLSPVVLGRSDIRNAFDVPQQMVRLRADNKIHIHAWNIAEDFRTLFVDKGATKELLASKDARIQFRDASEHAQVAIFSPVGINQEMLNKACGNTFK